MLKRKIDQAALTTSHSAFLIPQSLNQDSKSGESPFSGFQLAVFYFHKADREQRALWGSFLRALFKGSFCKGSFCKGTYEGSTS